MVARFQRLVVGKGHDHSSQISLHGQAVLPLGSACLAGIEPALQAPCGGRGEGEASGQLARALSIT